MKKFILLTLISFTFFHQYTYACTCGGPFTFCEGLADPDGNIYADIILRGKLTAKTNEGFEVQVDQLLYGNTSQSTIVIKPALCDFYIDPLEEGNEYIFALSSYFDNNLSLLPCNISYLRIENEVIKGQIAPGIESLDYKDLGTLEDCGNGLELFFIENSISIFPNPTTDILQIKNIKPEDSIGNIQIKFIDMIGRELYTFKKEDGIFAGEIWMIDLENFVAGVYFLKLIANKQEAVFRIVKQ